MIHEVGREQFLSETFLTTRLIPFHKSSYNGYRIVHVWMYESDRAFGLAVRRAVEYLVPSKQGLYDSGY